MPSIDRIGNLSFSQALDLLMRGRRVGATFLPEDMFIEVQISTEVSMNTEPYLKLVKVAREPGYLEYSVLSCEPWEPGRRSIFSKEWYLSPFKDVSVKFNKKV